MYHKMTKIYNRLQDDESKALFNAKITYLLNQNLDEFLEFIKCLYAPGEWTSEELEEKIALVHPRGIIIFGCGHDGRETKKLLELWNYEVACFCDNYKQGQMVDGKHVISVKEVVDECEDYLVVIGSSKYGKDMYIELVQKGFPYTNILLPQYFDTAGIVWGARGRQYFDMFEPEPDEIYVDAGTYDGETIIDFISWSNGKYKKIYAFEPISDMYEVIRQKMDQKCVKRIELFNNATWSKQEELCFTNHGSASHMSVHGEIRVQGIDIDSVVQDEKVTFIKMDIEGSELEALKGARKTIINNCPRLAICLYHKPIDIIEIPLYILSLVPKYKFYIRHYGSHLGETVLYAVL